MSDGTYVPFKGRTDQCKSSYPAMVAPAGMLAGNGPPEGLIFGNPGQRYRDLDNDDLYIKASGTQTVGWVLNGKYGDGGSAGGAESTIYSAVDPTGVISVTGPKLCIGTGAMDGKLWFKTSAGTASDWFAVIV